MFDVKDVQIWHQLGATGDIHKLNVLQTYLTVLDSEEQKKEDVDILIECGCSLENFDLKNSPSIRPLPIETIIDKVFESGNVNLDIIDHLHDEYNVPVETNGISDFAYVIDPEKYDTQLSKYIANQEELTVQNVKRMMKKGYMLYRTEVKDSKKHKQKYLKLAVNNSKLPFDVFEFLLQFFFANIDESEKNEVKSNLLDSDPTVFIDWIHATENITFEQIETLIEKYHFPPYQSGNYDKCSIHYIWENPHIEFAVMYKYWCEYGEKKFGKFDNLFDSFLHHILQNRELKTIDEMKDLEEIFKDCIKKTDDSSGYNLIHSYCENVDIETEILEYICSNSKYKDLIHETTKNGDKPIHILCRNPGLKIEHLQYFVEQLKIPMTTTNEAGFQPWQALHYLVDNEEVSWKKKDVEIMIRKLNINFQTRRAGEVILYRISKFTNWSIEGLIYLYEYYKQNYSNTVDLNSFKSAKKILVDDASAGGKTILMHLLERYDITAGQIVKLVDPDRVGLDIKTKDNNQRGALHAIAHKGVEHSTLRMVGNLLKNAFGDDFDVDTPDKHGITPFQTWLGNVSTDIYDVIDLMEVWVELGADITQNEGNSAYNMLHNYLRGCGQNTIRLAYLRKMCFDAENPWKNEEQQINNADRLETNRIKRGKFQVPLHSRPVPDNNTLFAMYMEEAVDQHVNVNVLEYFRSKKNDGVRAILDTTDSPLWNYMSHKNVDITVVKYLHEDFGCVVKPTASDHIIFQYMEAQSKRSKINWDVLDYFYELMDLQGNRIVDFKYVDEDHLSILHKYCLGVFVRKDFEQLINRYNLQSILFTNDSSNPTAAAYFYETRRAEIRPDIIQCFVKLGFDINEQINNRTPLQHYCEIDGYIMGSIVNSFIKDGGANVNDRVPGKSALSTCQVIAKSAPAASLKIMVEEFDVKLINARNRTQDIWYSFMDEYEGNFATFKKLLDVYISSQFEPIHLFHRDEKDKDKRVQFKIYKVSSDGIKFNVDDEKELVKSKNKKKLKAAKKYENRFVFTETSRDGLFKSCRAIAKRNDADVRVVEIPQKWLQPVQFQDFKEKIADIEKKYQNFNQTSKEELLINSLVIVDMDTIKKINKSLESQNRKINDIQLNGENVLMKYIRTNHPSDILVADIKIMKAFEIDFQHEIEYGMYALDIYLQCCDGFPKKSVVMALIEGGCPMNWTFEKKEQHEIDVNDTDQKLNDKEPEIVKRDYTAIHWYSEEAKSNLEGFKVLMECGADVTLESCNNISAVYYLAMNSENLTKEFITYLVNVCKINFNRQLPNGRALFHEYLRCNQKVSIDTIHALVDIAGCDPNWRDEDNEMTSMKAYIENTEKLKFDMEIISCLLELGVNVNVADNKGVYPIQHILRVEKTSLSRLMEYVASLVANGAKLKHILPNDSLIMQANRLFELQNMSDGYEMYNKCWCRIETWNYEGKRRVQSAIALDTFGSTKLDINIVRQNVKDMTKEMLCEKYPQFRNYTNDELDDEQVISYGDPIEEEEIKEKVKEDEHENVMDELIIDDDTVMNIADFLSN